MSKMLASFQKDGEDAMTSLDFYILVVFVWNACIHPIPSWKRIYVHKFVSWCYKNVISGEIDFVVTDS